MLDALQPMDLHGAAEALGVHPFEVVRLIVMSGADASLDFNDESVAALRSFGELESWWDDAELPEDGDANRRVVRGVPERESRRRAAQAERPRWSQHRRLRSRECRLRKAKARAETRSIWSGQPLPATLSRRAVHGRAANPTRARRVTPRTPGARTGLRCDKPPRCDPPSLLVELDSAHIVGMRCPRYVFGPVVAIGLGLLANGACDAAQGVVGSPCESDADCDVELICDEHDGKASCQQPHGHGDDDDDDDDDTSETSDSTTSETTTSSSSTTSDATSSGTDTTTGDGSTSGGTDGSTGGDSGELAAACNSLCACVETNCSEYSAYPFESSDACMDNCMTLQAPVADCFNSFCEDVPGSGDLAEHNCEHAWGGLGQLEC